MNSLDHHEAVWVVVCKKPRLFSFTVPLTSVLLDHLLKVELTRTNLVVVLFCVACALVNQVEEVIHAVEPVPLPTAQTETGRPSFELASDHGIVNQAQTCSKHSILFVPFWVKLSWVSKLGDGRGDSREVRHEDSLFVLLAPVLVEAFLKHFGAFATLVNL